jgi:hypothetical protein
MALLPDPTGLTKNIIKKNIMARRSTLFQLWDFLKVRKKWWLAPIIISLMLLGLLIVATQGSAVAPFIYTLF